MAIKRVINKITTLDHVSEIDEALDLENSDYQEYLKTGDKTHLKLKEGAQPTVFKCFFDLSGNKVAQIKDSMMSAGNDGKPNVALGSWTFAVVRHVLTDIINPANVPAHEQFKFKKDASGLVDVNIIAELDQLGITGEIFALYNNLKGQKPTKN